MPIRDEIFRIFGNIWASAPGALRQLPENATPPVVRTVGWGPQYSSTITAEEETVQQRWHENDSAIVDIFSEGIGIYDAALPYPQHAVCTEDGIPYIALRENGPGTANPAITPSADTGNTTWVTMRGATTAPATPQQPTATTPDSATLYITWRCPRDGGSVITQHNLQWKTLTQTWAQATTVNTTVPIYTLTGLTNGTGYEFRVRATNAIGTSDWSPSNTQTAQGKPPGGGSTLALTAEAGNAAVSLAWLEPDTGGLTITSYEIQWRSGDQGWSTTRQTTLSGASLATTHTQTELANGTEYTFRVRAVNSAGSSPWSNEASAEPVAPHTEPLKAPTPTVTSPSSGTLSVTWNAPADGGQPITSYDLRYRVSGTTTWTTINSIGDQNRTLTGLQNNTDYQIQVRAVNAIGNGPWSDTATGRPVATVPGAPTGVIAQHQHLALKVTWAAPADNGGANITGYTVNWRAGTSGAWSSASSTNREHTITGLTNGTSYQVRVRATNSVGSGAWSSTTTQSAISTTWTFTASNSSWSWPLSDSSSARVEVTGASGGGGGGGGGGSGGGNWAIQGSGGTTYRTRIARFNGGRAGDGPSTGIGQIGAGGSGGGGGNSGANGAAGGASTVTVGATTVTGPGGAGGLGGGGGGGGGGHFPPVTSHTYGTAGSDGGDAPGGTGEDGNNGQPATNAGAAGAGGGAGYGARGGGGGAGAGQVAPAGTGGTGGNDGAENAPNGVLASVANSGGTVGGGGGGDPGAVGKTGATSRAGENGGNGGNGGNGRNTGGWRGADGGGGGAGSPGKAATTVVQTVTGLTSSSTFAIVIGAVGAGGAGGLGGVTIDGQAGSGQTLGAAGSAGAAGTTAGTVKITALF